MDGYKHRNINIPLLILVCIIAVAAISFALLFASFALSCSGEIYETNDLNEYGNIIGNHDNNTPAEFIGSFFPESIDPEFSDVTYHYKAKKCDSYGFEAWLEFSFDDRADFDTYITGLSEAYDFSPFLYDAAYMEYAVDDLFEITPSRQEGEYSIQAARIGKILYNTSEKSVIFLAVGVCDGGGTKTDDVDYFFRRFEIDPKSYQEASHPSSTD